MAKQNLALRQIVGKAYGFVTSREFNEGISVATLDLFLQQQLAILRDGFLNRPSVKDRLEALQAEVEDGFAKIRQMDPSEFEYVGDEEKAID